VRRAAGVLGVGAAAREDAGGAEERTEEERDGGRRLGGPTAQPHKCTVPPLVASGPSVKILPIKEKTSGPVTPMTVRCLRCLRSSCLTFLSADILYETGARPGHVWPRFHDQN